MCYVNKVSYDVIDFNNFKINAKKHVHFYQPK